MKNIIRLRPQLKSVGILISVTLLLLQTSCVDLVGLRKFTDETVKTGAKFKELSQDTYRTCAAEFYYTNYRMEQFNGIKIFESPEAYLNTINVADRSICDQAKSDAANFAAANKMLMTYFYVMGQLAGDNVANTDNEFKDMKSALESLPGGKDPALGAAISIANVVVNILLDAQRQKAISKAITQNNTQVGTVTDGLSKWLSVYITRLENERSSLSNMYNFGFEQHKKFNADISGKDPSYDPLLVILDSRDLNIEVQALNTKIKAAKAYQKLLADIKAGHQELFVAAQKGFDKKLAVQIALKYAPAIQSSYDEINKAF